MERLPLRENTNHFDHEGIPEYIDHARGTVARGLRRHPARCARLVYTQ
ncbi:catalase [Rhizobium leguminosarum]|nr:catalase [Rhizobium leguminosarum]